MSGKKAGALSARSASQEKVVVPSNETYSVTTEWSRKRLSAIVLIEVARATCGLDSLRSVLEEMHHKEKQAGGRPLPGES